MKHILCIFSLLSLVGNTVFASDREVERKLKAHDTHDLHAIKKNLLRQSTLYKPLPNDDGGIIAIGTAVYVKLRTQPLRALEEIATPDEICTLALSPDGEVVAAGTTFGRYYLWNIPSDKIFNWGFYSTRKPIIHLAFSPDCRRLATASDSTAAVCSAMPSVRVPTGIVSSDLPSITSLEFTDHDVLRLANHTTREVFNLSTESRHTEEIGQGTVATMQTPKAPETLLDELTEITIILALKQEQRTLPSKQSHQNK